MAYPSALNTDKFLTGGVMDAPDLQTRTAMNKLAWGMPISAQEAKRITQRQGLEQQSINVAQEAAQKQALLGMRDVNVGSYAGSMWSPPGSYTAPRANQETVADLILKQRFGTFEQGQMRGTVNPVAATQSFAAGPTTTPITTTFRKTPDVNAALGLEGMGNILPQNIEAQNNPVANIPTQAPLIPAPKTISAVPQGGQVQLPPALQQLLGGQAQAQQSAYQAPQYPVGSALSAATPEMQRTALSQKSFGLQKEEFDFRKTQADLEEKRRQQEFALKQSKLAPVYTSPEEALAAAQKLPFDKNSQVASFTHTEGGYLPTIQPKPPQQFESGFAKLAAESTQKKLDAIDQEYNNAISAQQAATLAEEALKTGKVTTGFGAPLASFVKRVADSIGVNLGVTEQILAEKGIANMQQQGIRAIMHGLGSMSNADREYAAFSMPSIKDPAMATKYFIELAKENARLAKEDKAFIRQLQRADKNIDPAEIVRQVEERREGRNVAQDVLKKVMASEKASQDVTPKGVTPLSDKAKQYFK